MIRRRSRPRRNDLRRNIYRDTVTLSESRVRHAARTFAPRPPHRRVDPEGKRLAYRRDFPDRFIHRGDRGAAHVTRPVDERQSERVSSAWIAADPTLARHGYSPHVQRLVRNYTISPITWATRAPRRRPGLTQPGAGTRRLRLDGDVWHRSCGGRPHAHDVAAFHTSNSHRARLCPRAFAASLAFSTKCRYSCVVPMVVQVVLRQIWHWALLGHYLMFASTIESIGQCGGSGMIPRAQPYLRQRFSRLRERFVTFARSPPKHGVREGTLRLGIRGRHCGCGKGEQRRRGTETRVGRISVVGRTIGCRASQRGRHRCVRSHQS